MDGGLLGSWPLAVPAGEGMAMHAEVCLHRGDQHEKSNEKTGCRSYRGKMSTSDDVPVLQKPSSWSPSSPGP